MYAYARKQTALMLPVAQVVVVVVVVGSLPPPATLALSHVNTTSVLLGI